MNAKTAKAVKQGAGKGSLYVVLPKDWVLEKDIHAGETLLVKFNGHLEVRKLEEAIL